MVFPAHLKASFHVNSLSVAHLVCWDTVGGHYAVAMQDTVDLYSLEVRDTR